MTRKEKRPGWAFYTARKAVEDYADHVTRFDFALTRNGEMRIKDVLLHRQFLETRSALLALAQELKEREVTAITISRKG